MYFFLSVSFTNSVDPDEMQHYAAFIWVFTVCISTRLFRGDPEYKGIMVTGRSPVNVQCAYHRNRDWAQLHQ